MEPPDVRNELTPGILDKIRKGPPERMPDSGTQTLLAGRIEVANPQVPVDQKYGQGQIFYNSLMFHGLRTAGVSFNAFSVVSGIPYKAVQVSVQKSLLAGMRTTGGTGAARTDRNMHYSSACRP